MHGKPLSAAEGPLAALRARQAAGLALPDAAQLEAAARLDELHRALAGYRLPEAAPALLRKLGLARRKPPEPPRGLYIYGPVGRGKSMLMDLFFAGVAVAAKRRVHFHAFMQQVHDRAHRLRQEGGSGDPLPVIAREVAGSAALLCFDEFQVDNIADAMILGRLFEAMLAEGVVVVATSNVAPKDLYRDGLQRDRFLPFIALIEERLEVVELDGGVDHRLARLRGRPVHFVPADEKARAALDRIFDDLTDGARPTPVTLEVKGRRVTVPKAALGVARFPFDELCRRPLGPADYLAIAERFHTVIVDGVPRMSARDASAARRFVTFVDALYERRTNLFLSADAAPEELYPEGTGHFEFKRCASRLHEMQAEDYIETPHFR